MRKYLQTMNFSVRCYGKPWINFLANPICETESLHCTSETNTTLIITSKEKCSVFLLIIKRVYQVFSTLFFVLSFYSYPCFGKIVPIFQSVKEQDYLWQYIKCSLSTFKHIYEDVVLCLKISEHKFFQFSSVQSHLTLCDPMNRSMPNSLEIYKYRYMV